MGSMKWQLLDLVEIVGRSGPTSSRRRNPAGSRLHAAARERPIVVYGGRGKAIGEGVRLAAKRLGIDIEWIPTEPNASLAPAQRLSSRLRHGKISGVVLINGIMSHKQVIPVIDARRLAACRSY